MDEFHDDDIEQIAIIGMAGRFPGANNVDQFWQNLREGRECTTQFSEEDLLERGVTKEEFSHPDYVKSGLVLENIDLFDAAFFGYTAKQAEIMDPQQRIFLEIAWEALENAGCNPDTYNGAIGVFGGAGGNDYRKRIAADFNSVTSDIAPFQVMIANDPDFLTTRVAYSLNLKGPSFSLQTACSTSLVAVHVACQHLLMYQCDVALAGGVSIRLPQGVGYRYREGMIWSPDGHCRAFAADSGGTLLGRGAGIVVLKRLSEAIAERDTVYAVIKGSAINNDGALKVGFTAPSVDGQASVISMAQGISGVSPETISYVEAHGTGTPLGDPIEIQALTQAFRLKTTAKNYCAIGSVKTNIGHLDQAAGVAGLIKTVLSLKNMEIPPSLHCKEPNPNIDFPNSPFFVNTELTDWQSDKGPRRAGVSSFGIGGTNAHVILEEAPALQDASDSRSWQVLLLSARTETGVGRAATNLAAYLQNNSKLNLADAAYTLQVGRKHFDYRWAAVCKDKEQAVSFLTEAVGPVHSLEGETRKTDIIFMFSGQGSQYVGMGEGIYRSEHVFREQVDYCAEVLMPLIASDIREILFPRPDKATEATELINQTRITQPALFVIEYCLAKLLESWGITPKAMVGHSIGEYVAACLAGVFSLKDALTLVARRGKMMQDLDSGSMLAVPLSEKELVSLLPSGLSVAVINGPGMTVISGKETEIVGFKEKIEEDRGLECRILHTSHAFHSYMMEPIVEEFAKAVSSFALSEPQIPFVSNVSGTWISNEEATSPQYWASHLRQPVRFSPCINTLLRDRSRLFVEVGPGQVLVNLTKLHPESKDCLVLPITRRPVERKDDLAVLLNSLGKLWSEGVSVDWSAFGHRELRQKIPLPTYPFEWKKYWLDSQVGWQDATQVLPDGVTGLSGDVETASKHHVKDDDSRKVHIPSYERPDLLTKYREPASEAEKFIAGIWQQELGFSRIGVDDSFFELGGDSLLAVRVMDRIITESGRHVPLEVLANGQTIRALAKSLGIENDFNPNWTSLVLLREGTDKTRPKLFIPHGINGNVHWGYVHIIKHIDQEQPIYGFSVPAGKVFETFSEMASYYIKEMKELQPEGPYCLAGYCYSGALAYEIACQLVAAGDDVSFLGLIESWPTNTSYGKIKVTPAYAVRFIANVPFFVHDFLKMDLKGMRLSITNKFKRVRRLIKLKINTLLHRQEEASDTANYILFDEMFDINELKDPERYHLMENNLKLQREHFPVPCNLKAEVFRAKRQSLFSPHDPAMGWKELALNGVTTHVISGSHRLVPTEPYAQELSHLLSIRMRKAIGLSFQEEE